MVRWSHRPVPRKVGSSSIVPTCQDAIPRTLLQTCPRQTPPLQAEQGPGANGRGPALITLLQAQSLVFQQSPQEESPWRASGTQSFPPVPPFSPRAITQRHAFQPDAQRDWQRHSKGQTCSPPRYGSGPQSWRVRVSLGTLAPRVGMLRPWALPLGWWWSRSRAADPQIHTLQSLRL